MLFNYLLKKNFEIKLTGRVSDTESCTHPALSFLVNFWETFKELQPFKLVLCTRTLKYKSRN